MSTEGNINLKQLFEAVSTKAGSILKFDATTLCIRLKKLQKLRHC